MTTSFYNGVSGLISFQNGIDIWGDNIANVNTPGFKESLPEFATIFASTLNNNASPTSDIGLGSYMNSTAKDMSIGSLVSSDNPFDIAIAGKGWLAVNYNNQTFYTRNGSFTRDSNGFLVNDSGAYLMVANANNLIKTDNGYIVDRNINTDNLLPSNNLSPISLPNDVILPALPTKNVNLTSNLNDANKIDTTAPVNENIYFSAMYNKDGENMQIRNSQNLLYGFGNNVEYDNGLLKSTFCFNDDTVDNQDVNIDFILNDKEIKLTLPDGSTKEEIAKSIADKLKEEGFNASAENGELTIYTTDKFILKSNDNYLKNTAAAILTYKENPQNPYEFSTMSDFLDNIKNLADTVYPDKTNIYLDTDGRVVVENLSDITLNSYIHTANNSNESFLNNLGRVGNEIYPHTSNKSFEFLSNSQNYGGYIIDENGNKINVSFNFTKKDVQTNNVIWSGTVTLDSPDGKISKNFDLIFNTNGELITPKSINFNNINYNLNLTSYTKSDSNLAYSFNQDGIEKGYLTNYHIDENGKIIANFSNNKSAILGQIPIFHFQNPQGLESIGNSMFMATDNSNQAFLYTDNSGNYIPTKIKSSMLESSNVNMAEAMTELLITQKAFSAAAKTVTTSDEMIQKAINLKR